MLTSCHRLRWSMYVKREKGDATTGNVRQLFANDRMLCRMRLSIARTQSSYSRRSGSLNKSSEKKAVRPGTQTGTYHHINVTRPPEC